MDEVWLSAPLAAIRIWHDAGGVRWQLNPAAMHSDWGRTQSERGWQVLALRLMSECSQRPGGAEGRLSAAEQMVEVAWTAAALEDGWLVWLTPIDEHASRAKSEFLARMSHELRTPLNAVLGFAQLMLSDQRSSDRQQRERLAQMQTAGRHLLDLINDVLDLAGVEPDAPVPVARPVVLSGSVRDSMQWVAALAGERQVTLSADQISGTVLADRRRIRQILTNLLSNAVKYNRPGGSVEIGSLRREHDGQRQCGIAVRDTGIGMTAAQIQQLFQPFNRLGAEFSSVEGTGIGLTIVRQIVHRMGGHLEVDSKPRMGSTFTRVASGGAR